MESGRLRKGKLKHKLISIELICHGNMLRGIPIELNLYEKKAARETPKNHD